LQVIENFLSICKPTTAILEAKKGNGKGETQPLQAGTCARVNKVFWVRISPCRIRTAAEGQERWGTTCAFQRVFLLYCLIY
jgi:hypothetical protein